MILQYLFATDMDWNLRIMGCIFSICAVLFAIAIHESAHGLMSYALGDSTAKSQGRLSLNPFRHLNPIGTIMLLFLGFGWANPVVVQASKFKKPRLGMALTAAAGPLSNFIFGFIGIFISLLCQYFYLINQNNILMNTAMFFSIFASINVGLGLFNLIPLPPLDGSKILAELLPLKFRYKYLALERYSMYIFLGIIIFMRYFNFFSVILNSIISLFYDLSMPIIEMIAS